MTDRYDRQKDIIPQDRLALKCATVIGVGAVGRQVALQLTALGMPSLQLVDYDSVEETNIASQGYLECDLAQVKVGATGASCLRINSKLQIETICRAFDKEVNHSDIVFCCVDTMKARKYIWELCKDDIDFYCDSRMAAEALRLLTVHSDKSKEYYPTTLFSDEQAYQASCTAKATIYCANILAGLMLTQFAKYLRAIPVEKDISFNLLTTEIEIED